MVFGDNWGGGVIVWDTEEKEKLAQKRMEIENERMRIENERLKLILQRLAMNHPVNLDDVKEKKLHKSAMARLLTFE